MSWQGGGSVVEEMTQELLGHFSLCLSNRNGLDLITFPFYFCLPASRLPAQALSCDSNTGLVLWRCLEQVEVVDKVLQK